LGSPKYGVLEYLVRESSLLKEWQQKLHIIIYGTDTRAGRLFDIVLLWAILLSVLSVTLESVSSISDIYGQTLRTIEWIFTFLFSIEYGLRLLTNKKPLTYVFSFFGIIDLVSLIPTYLSIFFAGTQSLAIIRAVRLLRVFRVLKLIRFMGAADRLRNNFKQNFPRIIVFIGAVLSLAIVSGTLMYLIEGADSGFTSIPKGIYWAIVTITTVGYGDIAPVTVLGQFLASVLMIIGYGVIAVPAGMVGASIAQGQNLSKTCNSCNKSDLKQDSRHCRHCGSSAI
jgi:voltage-gated potassium channel